MTHWNLSSSVFLALSAPGMGEWIVILALVLLLFGGKNIPDLARALGKGLREFKRTVNGIGDPAEDAEPPKAAGPSDRDRPRSS